MAQFPPSFGTAFAVAGFSFDPNLSPNNQGFANAVLATVQRAGLPFGFEAANLVLAGPASGAAALPTYRALVAADVPGGVNGFGNPTNLVSGTATNGTSTLAMRSDGAPALDWAQSPTWTGNHIFNPASGLPLIVEIAGVKRFQVNGTTTSIQGQGPVAGVLVDMTPDTGSFTVTATGMTTSPTGTAVWARVGNLITLVLPLVTGTSNANTFTFTGLPAALQPARTQQVALPNDSCESGGALVAAQAGILLTGGSGTITFINNGSTTGWGATLIKGLDAVVTISYLLN